MRHAQSIRQLGNLVQHKSTGPWQFLKWAGSLNLWIIGFLCLMGGDPGTVGRQV